MPDPVVIDGEIVPAGHAPACHAQVELRARRLPRRHDIRDSPLWDWDGGHGLAGRIVTDAVEIAQIAERVAHYSQRGWWWGRG
jgi:hypothetical protein